MSGREELDRLKAEHFNRNAPEPCGYCGSCRDWSGGRNIRWPCTTRKLIAALEEALAQIAQSKDAFSGVAVEAVLAKLGERSE